MFARARTASAPFACLLALSALPAIAGAPKALDHVPADAQAVMVVPDLGELLNDINKANALMGAQGNPVVGMVTAMIRGMPGLNLDGSMATVLTFEPGRDEPVPMVLIPVSDFAAFTQGQQVSDGVTQFALGDGQVMYTRDAGGGYALFGETAQAVRGFDAAAGRLGAHEKLLGKAGGRIAEGNDIFFYVNVHSFDAQIGEAMRQMEAQGDMVEMMGGAEAAASFDQMVSAVRGIANDASCLVMGANFDDQVGVSFDVGMQFKDGSTSAGYLNNEGDAGRYFASVPAMDYFFAASYDMTGAGIKKFLGEYVDAMAKMDASGIFGAEGMKDLVTDLNGGVQLMGASNNLMGGIFSNMIYYADVKNPKAYIDEMRGMYNGMAQSMAALEEQGVGVKASMDEEPTTINGFEAYGHSFAMDLSQMNAMGGGMGAPNPAMVMQMVFGPAGGPSGYVAQAGDGLVMTLSRDAELFTKAAKAAGGENTMAGVESIKKTQSLLPANRVMEMYIAADHLANNVGPMLMMFGMVPEFQPVPSLPPLGMGLTADGGGVMLRTVLPRPTIEAMVKLVPAQAFDGLQGGDEYEDDGMDF